VCITSAERCGSKDRQSIPYVMSVAGGALIYTTIEEIPQITLKKDNDKGALAFVAGFALVMLMIFLKIGN